MTTREEAQRLADALERVNGEYDRDKETVSDAVQLLRQWPEAGEPGWMTIESAPKDGGMFLVWIAGVRHGETDEGQPYQQEEGQVDFAQWRTFEDGGYVDCFGNPYPYDQWGATHWMPLPAAPGAAQPAPAQQPDATPVSGSTHGLSQDYNGKLGKWFADRPGARQQLREDMAQAEQSGMVMVPREPTHEMLYAMAELDGWRKGDRDHPMFTRWEDYWNAALAAAPQAVLAAEIDVRSILLNVVPGDDGMGHEVYAKSVADVENRLSSMGQELEDWQLGIRRLLEAPAPQAVPQPLTRDGIARLKRVESGCVWYFEDVVEFVRTVERAHGITAKGDGNG